MKISIKRLVKLINYKIDKEKLLKRLIKRKKIEITADNSDDKGTITIHPYHTRILLSLFQ